MKEEFDWILKGIKKILVLILWLWVIAYITTYQPKKELESRPYWTNLDPTRPATDIKSYDFAKGVVEYRDRGLYDPVREGHRQLPSNKSKSKGITLKVNGAEVILDISAEEIIEQLDLDYNDIIDYYGVEMK